MLEEEEHKPDPWRNPIERNHMGLHLENEVYDKLLTPRQSFWITLYMQERMLQNISDGVGFETYRRPATHCIVSHSQNVLRHISALHKSVS